jgi:hypothetical protein
MVYKVLILDTSWESPITKDSVIIQMLAKSDLFEVTLKYRFSISMALEYSHIVFLNPRSDSKTIQMIESCAEKCLTYNPHLSILQIVPFVPKPSVLKYTPSSLAQLSLSGWMKFFGKTPSISKTHLLPHPPTNLLNSAMVGLVVSSEITLGILSGKQGGYKLRSTLDDFIYLTYFPGLVVYLLFSNSRHGFFEWISSLLYALQDT